jgi:hypothetical protein
MAVPLIESISPLAEVARRSWAANGAVRSSGYAGKTQVGVIVWRGKTLNRALEETDFEMRTNTHCGTHCVDQKVR